MSDPSHCPVILILGSPADREWGKRITDALAKFGVVAEVQIASAHKTPHYLLRLLNEWEGRETCNVYITVAGRSNALSAFVDAQVTSPVIACPPQSDAFGGMDILSSVRMPRGVAPLLVLEPENAALAAVKILAISSPALRARVDSAQIQERERVVAAEFADSAAAS